MRGRQAPAALLMDRPDRSLPLIVALLTVFVVPVVNPLGAQAAFELRSAPLPGGATLALRLDACATVGPLVQVRHHDDRLRFSLAPEDLGLACAAPTSGVGSAAEGSWAADWWVDEADDVVVFVVRETGAPRAHSLRSGERVALSPEAIARRLADQSLLPREQLRALDLAAAWLPYDRLDALRAVVSGRDRPLVARLRAAALLAAFGDSHGRALVVQTAAPRPEGISGMRPRAAWTDADLGEPQDRARRCDRPPPLAEENPDDPEAARRYAIQLLPGVLGTASVKALRALVRGGDPLDRLSVRTALLCLADRTTDDERAQRLEEVARVTGRGAGLRTDGPSVRELEASASSSDPYVAGQALRSLLAQEDPTGAALLRLLRRGTGQDGLLGLYFARRPMQEAVGPLVTALRRHPAKSRAAQLLVLGLRASVPEAEREALGAANGLSPQRWLRWHDDAARERRRSVRPLHVVSAVAPMLGLLWVTGFLARRRAE